MLLHFIHLKNSKLLSQTLPLLHSSTRTTLNSYIELTKMTKLISLKLTKSPFIEFSSFNTKKLSPLTLKLPFTKFSSFNLNTVHFKTSVKACSALANEVDVEVAKGYTMTQFCDKMIDVLLNEKPKVKEWKRYLLLREEWRKYRDSFYRRCGTRADAECDPCLKEKLVSLRQKVKKIDDEMERHHELLEEIQASPTDINAVVARRRNDFTGEFFKYITLLSETNDSLEDHDAMARLGARCLSAVSAYDNTLEHVETLDSAQAKFDDILNSPSVHAACEKVKTLAKAKELDSSLILLINSAWAAAKESKTMKNEVKEIMYQLYKATKSSLRSIAPKEIKLLKHLLNITDPEERFSALATAFTPVDEHGAKNGDNLCTTPKELHKWIKIMLDAYHLQMEETDIREAKKMTQPVVMQRLFILKETIEGEYLEKPTSATDQPKDAEPVEV